MRTKRRALVLTEESAGHPFRRSLPPHVLKGIEPVPPSRFGGVSRRDWRDFFAAYCASFVAVMVFIA